MSRDDPNRNVSPEVIDAVIATRGRVGVVEKLNPSRTALLVIDMQNFFMEPGQPLEVPAARGLVANINLLATALRACGGVVAWVNMTLDDAELDAWSVFLPVNGTAASRKNFASLNAGSHAHQLWPDLATNSNDLFINKCRFSAFIEGSSNLKSQLDERGIDTLLVVGTLTNVCCESTARDAMMLNYQVVMVDDANATLSAHAHRATLDTFLMYFGDVRSADQVVTMIKQSRP